MAEFTVIGKSVPRVDAVEKVTGKGEYASDIKFPGMLHGKVLRSPHSHARVLRVDTTAVERLPGVRAVIKKEDVPRTLFNCASYPPSTELFYLPKDQYIFDEKVRFRGEAVAAVAAECEEVALEALELIKVEYEELPAIFSPEEAMKPEAPLIHEVKNNIVFCLPIEKGDVEKGFKEADIILADRYTLSRVHHCTMEPNGVSLAYFDNSGRLNLWAGCQAPHNVRRLLSEVLGIPVSKILVSRLNAGGSFGGRLSLVNEPICVLLAKKSGKAVKLQYSREESFYASECRHPTISQIKTGVKKDGRLTAIEGRIIMDTGAYATHGPGVTTVSSACFGSLYRCENTKVEGFCVYTNNPPSGAYRGFGNPEQAWATESHLDTIAKTLGIDSLELRLKNCVKTGDMGFMGFPIQSSGLEECLRKGAEAIKWHEERKSSDKKSRGIGLACMIHGSGTKPFLSELSSVIIRANEDGTFHLITGAPDLGQGSSTALAQIAAEELGVPYQSIYVTAATDTDTTPFDVGTHASRVTYGAGNSVKEAAKKVKEGIIKKASEMLEVNEEDLETREGKIYVKGSPEKGLSFKEVAWAAQYGKEPHQIMTQVSLEPSQNAYPFSVHFAEVEVDEETGGVLVLKMVVAHDCGIAINPASLEGQAEGGLQHGLGHTLTEKLFIDSSGKISNPNLRDYRILGGMDMPEVKVILVESLEPTGPFGAKSIGESTVVPVAPAIGNAIYNATKIRIKDLPIDPERFLSALRERK